MRKQRLARIRRKTTETDIAISINLDGKGKSDIKSPLGFLNHMLALFAKHGVFDFKLSAKGDTQVDIHHTNEDIGISLGLCFKEALGQKIAIRRFGFASVPMDGSLVEVSLDLSGRPYFKFIKGKIEDNEDKKEYSLNYLKQFLQAFVNNSGITLHVEVIYGDDLHHVFEAVFKALGRALREACQIDVRLKGVPSTKGRL